MKNLIFVISFVFATAQLSWAQTSAPSKEWLKTAKEVVTTSNAWKAVNDVVSGGISPEMLNDRMWEDVLFAYPSHVQLVSLRGDYTLVDNKKNIFQFRDTTLNVWVTDLSVPFYIPPGVDVDDPKFLLPIYDGQQRIIKSYAPSGQGQDVLAEVKKSSPSDVAKVANVEWVEEDKAFFHEGRLYQKVGDKWETEDPDAPRAIKAGTRKKDPTFIFSKNAEGVWEPLASNKRQAYKFGMGPSSGYQNNYYRHARNGAPLGSGGWYGGPGSIWAPAPMWGGGFGNGWGGGFGGGFGFSFGFGMGFGGGWNNSFGCMPPPCVMCPNYNMDVVVWNRFTGQLMPTVAQGVGTDPYWGQGGWKSGGQSVSDAPVAEFKSSNQPAYSTRMSGGEQVVNIGRSPQGEQFADTKDLRVPATTPASSRVKAPTLELPPSHGRQSAPVVLTETFTPPSSHKAPDAREVTGTNAGRGGVSQGVAGANGRSAQANVQQRQPPTAPSGVGRPDARGSNVQQRQPAPAPSGVGRGQAGRSNDTGRTPARSNVEQRQPPTAPSGVGRPDARGSNVQQRQPAPAPSGVGRGQAGRQMSGVRGSGTATRGTSGRR